MAEVAGIVLRVWVIVCMIIIMLSKDYKSARGAIVSALATIILLARMF